VSRPVLLRAESLPAGEGRPGSTAPPGLDPVLEKARAWAGSERIALLLSGSHATGRAVWVEHEGRPVSLSDVDLYVVLPSAQACRDAETRASRDRAGLGDWLLERGFAAPLEAAFLTAPALASLPARPATLELRASARVIEGDPAWRERVPAFTARDVSAEETALLIENRGFELLMAHPSVGGARPLDRMRARHAVLKAALDLAAACALAAGEYPDGAEGRVAWARSHPVALPDPLRGAAQAAEAGVRADLERLWEAALRWRTGQADMPGAAESLEDWQRTARAWCALRWLLRPPSQVASNDSPYRAAVRLARRARLARRIRRSLFWHARSGAGPALFDRLKHALDGTPQHRVNAAAAVLLLAAVETCGRGVAEPALPKEAAGALARLGVTDRGVEPDWARAGRAVVRAWDRWVLDGQRTGDAS
jgi:hypothetical protein